MVLYRERLNDEKRVLSRWNSVSRGQDENAFAISKCEHFSTWRSIHCEREMGPFRKIDRRCSPRYFRFLSLFTLPHATPPFPSIDGTTANANEFLTHISFFSFSPSLERGGQKKNAKLVTIANHGLDSNPCRLRMEGVLNGYKTTDVEFFASKSPLAVLAAASHSSSFPFSLSLPSPSSLERTASTKLDKLGWGKVSRGGTTRENFIPSGVTVGTRFRSKGNADGFSYFRSRNGYRSFREIGHSYPDLVRRRRGKERPGAGLLKFFIVALFPFGQEARLRKTPKASISRKLGRARLEKVARSETAVGGNESREKGREKAREEGRTVEKMARDDAFQPSSNRGRNHSKSGRFQRQVSAMGQSS